jgi:beta-xylosidase
MPSPPTEEPVLFVDMDGGLWLSYNDYRALERNIIALREYSARLEVIIEFYGEGKNE